MDDPDHSFHKMGPGSGLIPTPDPPSTQPDPNPRKFINPEDPTDTPENFSFAFNLPTFLKFVGPGVLMSIAYIDPGNIAGDLDAGRTGGNALLWVLLGSTILGGWYQVLCSNLGTVTQMDMARICREEFKSLRVRLILWLMTEIAIIGSDIQEIIGSAIALQVLFGLKLQYGVLVTIGDTLTFLFFNKCGTRKLEIFYSSLLLIIVVCFLVNFFRS